ncbi:MAG: alpha/beta hydrolase [Lachnospiraceae bacterium]|nr:alpha/beta hydrolase [Lachnospiraceae bacterium]
MEIEKVKVNAIPAVIYGSRSEKAYVYVHGKDGHKEEAEHFAVFAEENGWQVISMDLPGHGERKGEMDHFYPWYIIPEMSQMWAYMSQRWKQMALYGNSIGAWCSMLAYQKKKVHHALLVSPILDMVHLIENMMQWAGISEEELEDKQVIQTSFGEELSWKYLSFAREHRITQWKCPTSILYGSKDHLTEQYIVDEFAKRHSCNVKIMEGGEHWFYTKEQLDYMDEWIKEKIR